MPHVWCCVPDVFKVSHLEGAAGIAGLLKAIAAMHHGQVPPNIHLAELNPHMDLEDVNMNFPTESAVELSGTKCTFGLSSFGFGGTNSHVAGIAPAASAEMQPVEDRANTASKVGEHSS